MKIIFFEDAKQKRYVCGDKVFSYLQALPLSLCMGPAHPRAQNQGFQFSCTATIMSFVIFARHSSLGLDQLELNLFAQTVPDPKIRWKGGESC